MNIFFGNVEQTALRSALRKPGLSLHLPRTCIHGRCNFLIVCVMYYMYIHTYVFMVEYDVHRYAVLVKLLAGHCFHIWRFICTCA